MEQVAKYPKSVKFLSLAIFIIIALVPFHAFLTTWIGSNTGGLLVWRAWKELLLIPVVLVAATVTLRDSQLRKKLLTDRLTQLMLIFIVWQLFVAAMYGRQFEPLALGLAIQLRSILVFLVARIIAYFNPPKTAFLEKLVLIPTLGVVIFAFLQMFILPYDFLKHFGYQKDLTIPPFFTIDEQLSQLRYASTLRGPNPLGTYLILPLILLLQKVYQRVKPQFIYIISVFAVVAVLYASHSRGAWIGAVAAGVTWLILLLPRKYMLIGMSTVLVAVLLVAGLGYQQRNTAFVQDVVLHDNPKTGGAISSNTGHIDAAKYAISDIQNKPLLGCGPGCAGPASSHNMSGVRFAENYFLQTAQESGLIGLGFLLAIFILAAYRLLQNNDQLSLVLLAVFIGINVASLFSHAWADDTIAYLWWALAGLLISLDRRTVPRVVKH